MSEDVVSSATVEPIAPVGLLLPRSALLLEHPLWKNPRTTTGLGDKELYEFGEDVYERGQIIPALVQRIADPDAEEGFVWLTLDGQRRCLGLDAYASKKKIARSKIMVKCVELYPHILELTSESADRMMLDVLAAAVKRAGISSFEEAEAAWLLSQHNEMSQKQIGDAIGRSESWVSRMVRARTFASDKLISAWAGGKVTDEQYKDLAAIQGHDEQKEALSEVLEERSKGGRENKAEARNKLKEKASKAKAAKRAEKKPSKKAVKKAAKKAAATKSAKDVLSSNKPALGEIIALVETKKPSDPYVKGIMDGARLAKGEISIDDFAPAWRTYMKQVEKIASASA